MRGPSMKWTWRNLTGLFRSKPRPEGPREPSDWWPPTPAMAGVAVVLLVFGGLAVWIIVRVVRFFGAFWAIPDGLTK